jgi:hypothetical protein
VIQEELLEGSTVLITEGRYDDFSVLGLYRVHISFCICAPNRRNLRTTAELVKAGLLVELPYDEVWMEDSIVFDTVPMRAHLADILPAV